MELFIAECQQFGFCGLRYKAVLYCNYLVLSRTGIMWERVNRNWYFVRHSGPRKMEYTESCNVQNIRTNRVQSGRLASNNEKQRKLIDIMWNVILIRIFIQSDQNLSAQKDTQNFIASLSVCRRFLVNIILNNH